jgi:hypothetical protein
MSIMIKDITSRGDRNWSLLGHPKSHLSVSLLYQLIPYVGENITDRDVQIYSMMMGSWLGDPPAMTLLKEHVQGTLDPYLLTTNQQYTIHTGI